MKVMCPHCDEEIEIYDGDVQDMQIDGVITDYVCPECEKAFDIEVEMVWQGYGRTIQNVKCDCCQREFRSGSIPQVQRSSRALEGCYPFPLNIKYNNLCSNCYRDVLYAEIDARKMHVRNYTASDIDRIRDAYKPCTKLIIDAILDPYRPLKTALKASVVKVRDDGVVIAKNDACDSVYHLYDGYDDFRIEVIA